MSLPDWILQFKEPHTQIKFIKNKYYKYAVTYKYVPERKRTLTVVGHLLGSITKEDGFIPSAKNKLRELPHLSQELKPKVSIKRYGVYALFKSLLADEISKLKNIFGNELAEQLLTFSMMRWAYQSTIKRIVNYQAHDFCSENWCKGTMLSDKKVTALLKYFGENREDVIEYMKSLLPDGSANSENFVMMDSTHVMSASENLGINAVGYNPSFDFGKQIRLMYMFSAELKKPVYYRLINGNITDITSMSRCIKELDIQNVVFVADKGFYSEANIKLLGDQKLKYIIPLRRNNHDVDLSKLSDNNLKKTNKYFLYQNRTIWYYEYEKDKKKFITFLDDRLRVKEENDYLQRISTQPDNYSNEDFIQKLPSFGTLTLAYNIGESSQQLYELYKQRNEIEVMFDSYKNFLKADVMYMQDRHVCEGWLFANFIAMIAYYKLYDRLRRAKLLGKESPKDIIELAKAVDQIKIQGEWTRSEIPERVCKIFKKIDIDCLK
jgi:transposase